MITISYSLYFVKKVFTEFGIARFLWNSIFITIVSTGLTLVVACLAAFSYKAYEYRMKETFRIRIREAPRASAALTYSFSFTLNTTLRIRRA